ncbi:MAG: 16S rRNA (cytosine(967)-C(5))-methyltransferase RsmB [Magnetococcales bacterium]|nr:16S rRNA (cytosine(967)-C(5))-methyltransferase RsmB [Magnetococcales bacterium]
MPRHNPRRIAVEAVVRVMRDGLALELNEAHLSVLEARDRALAMEIATGTLRHLSLLDALLSACMERPLPKGRHFLWGVLRTALYQARWLRIPARAAIHEAVELVKASPDRPRAGFVNALLRRAALLEPETILAGIGDGIARLAVETAHPEWLVRRWVDTVGLERTRQRLEAGNRPASLVLRANGLVMDQARLLAAVGGEAVGPEGVRVESGSVEALPGYREGWFAVQDGAAQWVARLLRPQPGEALLDVCAAPGGKTAHLAALAQGQAAILAVDRSTTRLRRLQETMTRLGVPGVEVLAGDATDPELLSGRLFDKALADVPCTGTGVIRRHPDIKWRRTADDPVRMAALQQRILTATALRVRPGGVLVYAVCSLEPEEGEEQIGHFLASHPHWVRQPITLEEGVPQGTITPDGDFHTEPGREGMDGFFVSRLKRQNG